MNTFDLNSQNQVELLDELPFWSAPFGLKLLDAIELKKNITALDIGFGLGFPLTEIAMRLGKTSKIYGIDPWQAAIKRTEKKITFYNITNVELIEGQAEKIPLPDNSLDLISSNNGINNVTDLNQVLSECSRLLRPEGQFVQTMNLEASMVEFYNVMKSVLQATGLDDAVQSMYKHIYHKRKPLYEYKQKLEAFDFKVKSIHHHSFEYRFVDGTTLLEHYFIRLAFMDDWKRIVPESMQEEVFYQIEEQLNQIARHEGGVKLTIPFVVIDCEKH